MNNILNVDWRELGISKDQAEKITNEVIEVMRNSNLSLNQATVILDSVKNVLSNKPLWSSHCQ